MQAVVQPDVVHNLNLNQVVLAEEAEVVEIQEAILKQIHNQEQQTPEAVVVVITANLLVVLVVRVL